MVYGNLIAVFKEVIMIKSVVAATDANSTSTLCYVIFEESVLIGPTETDSNIGVCNIVSINAVI